MIKGFRNDTKKNMIKDFLLKKLWLPTYSDTAPDTTDVPLVTWQMSRRRFSCCGFVVLHEAARLVLGVSRRGVEITGGSTSTFKKNTLKIINHLQKDELLMKFYNIFLCIKRYWSSVLVYIQTFLVNWSRPGFRKIPPGSPQNPQPGSTGHKRIPDFREHHPPGYKYPAW